MSAPDGRRENPAGATGQTCDRPSGSQPRNRQHRALEYYFGRDHVCLSLASLTPTKVFGRNPYRTQIVFMGLLVPTSAGIYLAHTRDDVLNVHRVLVLPALGGQPIPAAGFPAYTAPLILSFPVHGPLVGEEWWCLSDNVNNGDNLDATGYNYSD